MHEFDRLTGTWHGEGDFPDPPMHLVSDAIDGRWERGLGPRGDQWELDFPLTYVRTVIEQTAMATGGA